ncbi:hypothetical protein BS78_04G032200 [Paspalum vaginatum]|nr:hypothetical protein BS78_04G032200 [Paspalum vaginatum]
MDDESRPSKKPRGGAGSGLTAFALRMAKQLHGTKKKNLAKKKNLVFSPLSLYVALALVVSGARRDTLDELLALLGAASREELDEFARGVAERALADQSAAGGPRVAFACGLWHEKTLALKPAYRDAAVDAYKAETRAADFVFKVSYYARSTTKEAREEINRWVSKATSDLITSILPERSVHPLTGMVLANAIYFKGSWSLPFDKELTVTRRFRRLDGSRVRVPFMSSGRSTKQAVAQYKGFKVLKLAYAPYRIPTWDESPYQMRWDEREKKHVLSHVSSESSGGARFSMCVFLPDARAGLPGLVDRMAAAGPSFLWDHLPKDRVEVGEVRLPRFKLSSSSKLKPVLQAMGVEAAFDADRAHLSGMLVAGWLVLEQVFHKAVVEVNEEGTEAASSGACTIMLISDRLGPTPDFVADHPFAFFVVEEVSGTVVFMGHVLDPSEHAE